MINIFFDKLGDRFYKENNLSDITWALAESNEAFKTLFLKFFFTQYESFRQIEIFKREHSNGDCRPDFYISTPDFEYVIECKIDDRNHHFEHYRNQFPNAKFGYIANYKLPPVTGFEIRTWNEFKNYLKNTAETHLDDNTKIVLQSYIVYLTKVCSLIELKKMNLSNLTSLYQFNQLIKKVITSVENVEANIENSSKPCDHKRCGYYFKVKSEDGGTNVCPWIGIWYEGEKPLVYIEFGIGWCKPIYEKRKVLLLETGETFMPPYEDHHNEPALCFQMKDEVFAQFNSETATVEDQERIVRVFLTEVFTATGILIKKEKHN